MKRLFAFAPGLFLVAMTAVPAAAQQPLSYSISDQVYAEPVSALGGAPTPGQKDDYSDYDTKGGKGKGGGACDPFDLGDRLFGADSAWDLGGWTQFGYHSSNDGVFNTHPGTVDLHITFKVSCPCTRNSSSISINSDWCANRNYW